MGVTLSPISLCMCILCGCFCFYFWFLKGTGCAYHNAISECILSVVRQKMIDEVPLPKIEPEVAPVEDITALKVLVADLRQSNHLLRGELTLAKQQISFWMGKHAALKETIDSLTGAAQKF